MCTIYGYARVSTTEQILETQTKALKDYGCQIIFYEKISGRKNNRPKLNELLKKIQPGDKLVVWKLDRLGRTTLQLMKMTHFLNEKKVDFVSLKDQIDTSTAIGKLYFTVLAGLAEMEVDLLRERTLAGLENARRNGRFGGRPKLTKEKALLIHNLYHTKKLHKKEIAKRCHVSLPTVYKYIR